AAFAARARALCNTQHAGHDHAVSPGACRAGRGAGGGYARACRGQPGRTGLAGGTHRCAGGAAMIARIIRWSLQQRLLVLLSTLLLSAWGLWSLQQTPLDALPDLSDP